MEEEFYIFWQADVNFGKADYKDLPHFELLALVMQKSDLQCGILGYENLPMLAQNSTLGKSRANEYLLLLLLFPLKYPILKKFSGKYTQMSLERFSNKVFRTSVTPVYRKTEGSAFL